MTITVRAPKAEAERISKLVNRVNHGEIKIPRFQRGFVWRKANVLSLLESLLNGYPVGSLLFWRTEEKLRSERDIAGFQLPETQEKYPTNYVLDGQQRLTTIYGVLSWNGDSNKYHILNVIYDLRGFGKPEESRFRHREPSDGPWCLPLNILLDFSKFNAFQRQLDKLEDGDALSKEAERVNETFREYEIPIVTITERSLKEVCPIFERINSTGMKLTVYDLMVASTYHSEFDLNDEVEKITQATSHAGFDLDGVGVIRTAAALQGVSCKRSSLLSLEKLKPTELRRLLDNTRRAIEKAIDFLRAEVGVISGDFLPYEAQLTILAKLCSLASSFTPEQRKLIRSWFWLSSFHERYRGASDNILDADVQACKRLLNDGQPLIPFREFTHNDLHPREFRKGTAVSNAFVALLAVHRPRSLIGGAAINIDDSLSWSNRREFHHIFPRKRSIVLPDPQQDNVLANVCILPSADNKAIAAKDPSSYFKELATLHKSEIDDILASNLIPPLQASGLIEGDFEYFVHVRSEYIASKLNNLCRIG